MVMVGANIHVTKYFLGCRSEKIERLLESLKQHNVQRRWVVGQNNDNNNKEKVKSV